ncbi:MAG: EAL domain-containing protein [Gammaproteobacteria bacterium]|nr:EAL domain-containing protein [Rhodocyclaceae bacterium]MBU3909585.1 EAL domain-containing protein [Gammaproteobacteria bacterium]MBU3989163.1 EAL domain-containing protein [Gammaproteobacteria bacterium]MBU4003248.1 EAL domain-containing protein [Gammaproteobacteria bacterium]MBU4022297.1 EAL domain-containing protein [Gammaproteobacteria bacterium]
MATEEIFIGRQPILDRSQQLFAYELLFRSGSKHNCADIHDNLGATANVINHAFAELGIEQALGPYKGFINCDESLLLSDMLEILPTDKIVLEVLETVEVTPQIIERCTDLKARGFTLALDDFVDDERKWQPLLDLIEVVKVDLIPLSREKLGTVTSALRRWPLTLLAEKVERREEAEHCHQLGYNLFQGYYFARPAIIAGRKLGHSQLMLVRLLGLVMEDAETSTLESIFKQEPGLAVNLLRLTNSVATGVRVKVTSLRQAITVLGRRQLQRWLQLLLYTNPAGGSQVASPLLQLAATRGRFLELLAGKLRPGVSEFEDRAFMVGIMSLMPVLMGVPLEEILKGIQISGEMQEALEHRSGQLGIMLHLAEALEADDGEICHLLTSQLPGADHMMVNTCLTQALAWASNIGRE